MKSQILPDWLPKPLLTVQPTGDQQFTFIKITQTQHQISHAIWISISALFPMHQDLNTLFITSNMGTSPLLTKQTNTSTCRFHGALSIKQSTNATTSFHEVTAALVLALKSSMCQGNMPQWKAMNPHILSTQGNHHANRLISSIWLQAPRGDLISYYIISSPWPFLLGLREDCFQGERGRTTPEVRWHLTS